jgi:hypothetical protein
MLMRTTLTPLLLGLLLVGCSRREGAGVSHEDQLRHLLAVTWVMDMPSGAISRYTTTFGSNGQYVCEIQILRSNTVEERVELRGTQEVRGGVLIDTVLQDTQTNAPVPRTTRAQIIRASEREVVLRWESMTADSVMRKEEQ